MSFERLRSEREALRNYVLPHADSLRAFKEDGRPWFRRQEAADEATTQKIRHITTTASCIESLYDVPAYDGDDPPPPCPSDPQKVTAARAEIVEEFAQAALAAKDAEWQSEKAARVYCRVRTLPVILRLSNDATLERFGEEIKRHLEFAWDTIEIGDTHAQGVAELPGNDPRVNGRQTYPPNAFHTYWAVKFLREYRDRQDRLPQLCPAIGDREAVAQLWARRTLATHAALISAGQPTFDAHQLAWALSTDVLSRSREDQPTTADLQHIELYDAALKAFFGEQRNGRWPLYDPLFHYPQAGNAYCYTYETLAELLRLALHQSGGRVLRDHLRDYAENLIEAWHYARSTALTLQSGGTGWSSGHHPHRTNPEAWASASVFSYLQNLRCLIGHWTAEAAGRDLQVRQSSQAPELAREMLADRGNTWRSAESQTVSRQLASLFLNPIDARQREWSYIDHDRPLVGEARSAVLFGPPGTSKTTLVESIADGLSWSYLEVHASDFLSDGMDSVPAKADSIFMKLMELDHCVVLFDEIDELIRVRDSGSSAPFGRFLTTSMLPKLAKLWNQRRVLFFVATNDIEAADPAIKRSQRFDAAIFVSPPSFEKKKEKLEQILKRPVELTSAEVEAALNSEASSNQALGVFALLRWDQIADLAHRIEVGERRNKNPAEALKDALDGLGRELSRTDWQGSNSARRGKQGGDGAEVEPDGAGPGEAPSHRPMFERWRQQSLNERRDYRNAAVLQLDSELFDRLHEGWEPYGSNPGYLQIGAAVEGALDVLDDGSVKLTGDGWTALDRDGVFSFRRS